MQRSSSSLTRDDIVSEPKALIVGTVLTLLTRCKIFQKFKTSISGVFGYVVYLEDIMCVEIVLNLNYYDVNYI